MDRELISRELVKIAKSLLSAPSALELQSYESNNEIAIDIEHGLKGFRYIDYVKSGGKGGLQLSLRVTTPKDALYKNTSGIVYLVVDKSNRGVLVKLIGDIFYDEYDLDEDENPYYRKSGSSPIKDVKMFRSTNKVSDIVKWIDKVIRKSAGRDLIAKSLVGGLTDRAVSKLIDKVNREIIKTKRDDVWPIEPDSTWETAYEIEPIKLSRSTVIFKYKEVYGGKKFVEKFNYKNDLTVDDLKWQFRWVLRAIKKGYKEAS